MTATGENLPYEGFSAMQALALYCLEVNFFADMIENFLFAKAGRLASPGRQ